MPTSTTTLAASTAIRPAEKSCMTFSFCAAGIWPWISPTAYSANSARSCSKASCAALSSVLAKGFTTG